MYVIRFIDNEEWYLLCVDEYGVQATRLVEEAEKFETEPDAKAATCLFPDCMKFVIQKLGNNQ